ncbi:MAG: hypothetical protein HQL46_12205 [Gammaproteobacteria bacterium]|nr:hypothetical protein [Gammaproteobacteria bacterium]
MNESIFAEFQYYIKRINNARKSGVLEKGETLDNLEERFRLQVEKGLVISEPDSQEVAMEILLSDLTEDKKKAHLLELRKTGKTAFKIKKQTDAKLKTTGNKEADMERALNLIVSALKESGLRVQKQPLAVKMLMAAHELGNFSYTDPSDLKLLFVNTIKLSGHVKKADPLKLAETFNKLVD